MEGRRGGEGKRGGEGRWARRGEGRGEVMGKIYVEENEIILVSDRLSSIFESLCVVKSDIQVANVVRSNRK